MLPCPRRTVRQGRRLAFALGQQICGFPGTCRTGGAEAFSRTSADLPASRFHHGSARMQGADFVAISVSPACPRLAGQGGRKTLAAGKSRSSAAHQGSIAAIDCPCLARDNLRANDNRVTGGQRPPHVVGLRSQLPETAFHASPDRQSSSREAWIKARGPFQSASLPALGDRRTSARTCTPWQGCGSGPAGGRRRAIAPSDRVRAGILRGLVRAQAALSARETGRPSQGALADVRIEEGRRRGVVDGLEGLDGPPGR